MLANQIKTLLLRTTPSAMKLNFFPSITTAAFALAPASVEAWALRPSFFGFDRPLVLSPSRFLRDQEALVNRMGVQQSSPRYEILNDDKKFQVAVDVPGVKMEDIHVSLEGDNSVLSISGMRESSGESYTFTSKFSQSFSLDPSIDIDKFEASLKDGVLIVTAPKDEKRAEQSVRTIPIVDHSKDSAPKLSAEEKEQIGEGTKQDISHESHQKPTEISTEKTKMKTQEGS